MLSATVAANASFDAAAAVDAGVELVTDRPRPWASCLDSIVKHFTYQCVLRGLLAIARRWRGCVPAQDPRDGRGERASPTRRREPDAGGPCGGARARAGVHPNGGVSEGRPVVQDVVLDRACVRDRGARAVRSRAASGTESWAPAIAPRRVGAVPHPADRRRRSRCSELRVHDGPLFAFTMLRASCSRTTDLRVHILRTPPSPTMPATIRGVIRWRSPIRTGWRPRSSSRSAASSCRAGRASVRRGSSPAQGFGRPGTRRVGHPRAR